MQYQRIRLLHDAPLGWYAFLAGTGAYFAATVLLGSYWAMAACGLVLLAVALPTRRHVWMPLVALCWLAMGATALVSAKSITHATVWVTPVEALILALTALAAGEVPLPPRTRPLATGAMLLLFGYIQLTHASTIVDLTPAWLPLRQDAPYASAVVQIVAGIWLIIRPSPWPTRIVAALYLAFLPLVHLPRLVATPRDATEWQFAAMALALAGAVILCVVRLSDRRFFEDTIP